MNKYYLLPLIFILGSCFGVEEVSSGVAMRIRYDEGIQSGHGSCFAISDKLILTAAHNVLNGDKPYKIVLVEIDGVWHGGKVTKFNKDLDLAIFAIEDTKLEKPVKLGEDCKPKDTVMLAASNKNKAVEGYLGIVKQRYFEGSTRTKVKVEFDHGCSGGPLIDTKTGLLVGIAIAGELKKKTENEMVEGVGLFQPVSVIKAFIEDEKGDQ